MLRVNFKAFTRVVADLSAGVMGWAGGRGIATSRFTRLELAVLIAT